MADRCIAISRFALNLCKKNTSDLSEVSQYINDSNSEASCISVCNVIFSYYKNQYRIASTDEQRKYVSSSMLKLYNDIFRDGKYLSEDTISILFSLACNINDGDTVRKSIESISAADDMRRFPVTCNYIYRYCSNYIVDTSIFYKEPYTSILDKMMTYVSENNPAVNMPPDYLS